MHNIDSQLPLSILDILPNPVLVKDAQLQYVWINQAFETLFNVEREVVVGQVDKDLFPGRQVVQCSGGDLRVLETGEVDEAVETVYKRDGQARETITRKSRLTLANGQTYLVGVMHDITDVTRANDALKATTSRLEEQAVELSRLATTDVLTGCYNRRMLSDCGRNLFENTHVNAAMLMLDIDFFKAINDTHGHDCGDDVLRHFSELVRSQIDNADAFIRLGGEEFAICLSRPNKQDIATLAERICTLIGRTPLIYRGQAVPVTVSIGVAEKHAGTTCTVDEMLTTADERLYEAKSSGRNRVVLVA